MQGLSRFATCLGARKVPKRRCWRQRSIWVAALFGLLGVIVGGVLNTWLGLIVERHRTSSAARVAARLIRNELLLIAARATATCENDIYGPEVGDEPFDIAQWNEGKTTLAAVLSEAEWATIIRVSITRVEVLPRAGRRRIECEDSPQST